MSVITLHYGQCGNQISDPLFSNIYEDIICTKKGSDYYSEALYKWFHVNKKNKWEPRSVIIDTENKSFQIKKNCPFQFRHVITKSTGGSANNWAFGYLEKSKLLMNEICESIRKETEKCDYLSSFLNVFSSSGGTGSGVGTYVVEYLKNEFPNKVIVNAVILPYSSGEVVIQSYNTLLTFSKIYSVSDAIIIFENDRLHYNCNNSLNIKDVGFGDINNLIARQLLTVYQPLKDIQAPDLLTKLCENSFCKLLQIQCAPLSKLDSHDWKSLLTAISRQSRFDFHQKTLHNVQFIKPKCLSTALICRGVHNPSEQELKPFKDFNTDISRLPPQIYYQLNDSWSIEDKKKLLVALQKYGTSNIADIQKTLPNKTITEIRKVFEKYSHLASIKMNRHEKLREDDSAINQWINIVKKTHNKTNGVFDVVARVLKYIALFEKRPHDKDVNLRDCYMAISEMSNGMVSKNLNSTTSYFLYDNLSKLALRIRQDKALEQKKFIRNIKSSDIVKPQLVKTYNRNKTKVNSRVNVILNPLNVPQDLLKKN